MVARNRQCGNVIIEVVTVVAIIGITASIAIPRFMDSIDKAKFTSTVADMKTMGKAWQLKVKILSHDHGDNIVAGDFHEVFYDPEILTALGKTAKATDHWGNPYSFGKCTHGHLLQCSGGPLGPITDYAGQCIGPLSKSDVRVPLRRIIIVSP